jgi:FkbM family methyltransferase
MKKEFYVHSIDNLVNLENDAEILKTNWGKRFEVTYPESVTYHEVYKREDYFQGDCVIEPGDVVVDCGGNIGIFSSIAFDMGASRVLSFEPFPNNFELNKKNNSNAEVFNLAVSNKSNENVELLYTHTGNGGHSIIESEYDREPGHFQHKNIFVKTITLDDIISQNFIDHIDFLKIDTEGAELKILEGLSDNNLDKVKSISMEYHHCVFNYDDNIYIKFQERFLKRGFNVFTWILDKDTRMVYINKGDVFVVNKKHI